MEKEKLYTPELRFSYPYVFEPRLNKRSGKKEFCFEGLFFEGEKIKELKTAAKEALREEFGDKMDNKKFRKSLTLPWKDQGDKEKEDDEGNMVMPEGYKKGCLYMNFKSYQKPGLVDHNAKDIMDQKDFYGGCYGVARVVPHAYDVNGNKGVSFWVTNIQKTREGKPFGNRSRPQDDFSKIENAKGGESIGDDDDEDSDF